MYETENRSYRSGTLLERVRQWGGRQQKNIFSLLWYPGRQHDLIMKNLKTRSNLSLYVAHLLLPDFLVGQKFCRNFFFVGTHCANANKSSLQKILTQRDTGKKVIKDYSSTSSFEDLDHIKNYSTTLLFLGFLTYLSCK